MDNSEPTTSDISCNIPELSNVDVQYIQAASVELKQTTASLKSATNRLKQKLALYNIYC